MSSANIVILLQGYLQLVRIDSFISLSWCGVTGPSPLLSGELYLYEKDANRIKEQFNTIEANMKESADYRHQ